METNPLRDCLGPPVLAPGQSIEDYERLSSALQDWAKPRDTYEEIIVQDVVYHQGWVNTCRSANGSLIANAKLPAMKNVLSKVLGLLTYDIDQIELMAQRYIRKDAKAVQQVTQILQENELTPASFDAEAFAIELPKIILIEQLATRAETRRNNVPRLLRVHRASTTFRPQQIEGAEYRAIEHSSGGETSST